MTIAYIQTRVDRIKALADEIAAYEPEPANTGSGGASEPATPGSGDPSEPPVNGSDIISVYNTEWIKCDLIKANYNRLRKDFWNALNTAAKESGVKWTLILACPPTHEDNTAHFEDGLRADFRYPKLMYGGIDVIPIMDFVASMDRQRPKMEYVMAAALEDEWEGVNNKITFSDKNGHDKHIDVYWGVG